MKQKTLTFLLLACILFFISCKGKEQARLPDTSNKITEFATIPSVKAMFLALENLDEPGPSTFKMKEVSPASSDSIDAAFAWGVLFTNLQMAVNNRNSAQLRSVMGQMTALSPDLGLEDITEKLMNNVSPLISEGNWPALENTFYNVQYSIEQALSDQKRYEIYTLMGLGAWTEVTNGFARLVELAYSSHRSALLLQEGAWQYLENNLMYLTNGQSSDSPVFQNIITFVREIGNCIENQTDKSVKQERVALIIELTDNIRAEFLQQ